MSEQSETGSRTREFLEASDPSELDWYQFVERYGPRILEWCRAKGLNRNACEQVTQDVLTRLSKSLKTFRRDGYSFRGWLYGVTRNAIADYRTTWERGDVQFLDATALLLQSSDHFIDEIVANEIQQIAEARTRLKVTLRQWEVFVLRQKHGLDYDEIAARLNISVTALYNSVSAVRTTLESEIAQLNSGATE